MPQAAECAGCTPVSVGEPVCIRVCNSVMSVCHVALLRLCVECLLFMSVQVFAGGRGKQSTQEVMLILY